MKYMYTVMMPKEGSTKIVNVLILGAGVLMLGRGHVCHYSECASSTLSIYSTLIATVRDYIMLLSYAIADFYLFYDGAVDICKYEPF